LRSSFAQTHRLTIWVADEREITFVIAHIPKFELARHYYS